jgi:hypothetical protein
MHHLLLKKITKTLGLGWFGVVYSWSLCILGIMQIHYMTSSKIIWLYSICSLTTCSLHTSMQKPSNSDPTDGDQCEMKGNYFCQHMEDLQWRYAMTSKFRFDLMHWNVSIGPEQWHIFGRFLTLFPLKRPARRERNTSNMAATIGDVMTSRASPLCVYIHHSY